MRAFATFFATVVALMAPASAENQIDLNFYGVDWQVGPQDLPKEPVTVDRWEEILSLNLVPMHLYATRSDVLDANGKGLLPAGAQLVRMTVKTEAAVTRTKVSMACSIAKTGSKGFVSAKKHVCLVDETSDGTFENWFERGMGGMWRFAPEGRDTPKLQPLPAVALDSIPPQDLRDPPRLAIGYQRILDVGNLFSRVVNQENVFTPSEMPASRVRFYMEVYADGKFGATFSDMCNAPELTTLCADAVFPGEFAFAGMKMRLIERQGEKISLTVDRVGDPVIIRFSPFDGDTYPRTGDYVVVQTENAQS